MKKISLLLVLVLAVCQLGICKDYLKGVRQVLKETKEEVIQKLNTSKVIVDISTSNPKDSKITFEDRKAKPEPVKEEVKPPEPAKTEVIPTKQADIPKTVKKPTKQSPGKPQHAIKSTAEVKTVDLLAIPDTPKKRSHRNRNIGIGTGILGLLILIVKAILMWLEKRR